MGKYILRRLLLLIPTLIGMSLLIFVMVRVMPGDIVDSLTGFDPQYTEAQRAQLRHGFGLDKPMTVQYVEWITQILQGNLGISFRTKEPITQQIVRSMPITLEIAILAICISIVLAIPLGVISAVKQNSATDLLATILGLLGLSFPSFWLATMFLLITSLWFHWTPSLLWVSPFKDPVGNAIQMALPALSMSVGLMASEMRMARSTMLEVLRQDYIRTARAKGLSEWRVVARHALKNAFIPVITVIGLQLGGLMGGSVIVEQIYGLPGMGWTLLQGVNNRDYAVMQVAALLMATIFVCMNLLVDVAYAFFDPRIRYE